MRVKYLGTKALIVLATMLATPVVWAALAWPEWSSASPIEEDDLAVVEQSAPQAPEVVIQKVLHRVVVVPRYIEVEATPSISPDQPQVYVPVPVNTPEPVPTAPPASAPPAANLLSPTRPVPTPEPQPKAPGSSGGNSNSNSSDSAQTAAPPPTNSKTQGS